MRVTIAAGDLTAVIGDNEADEGQRAGYNGVQALTSVHRPDNLFVPGLAGINLEHLFDGRDLARPELFFEPRQAPMEVERVGDQAAILHQAATPTLRVQSMTTFTLRRPHYLDLDLRLVLRAPTLRYDYLLAFWASYLNAPEDRAMYFLGRPRAEPVGEGWQRLFSEAHYDRSTVCPAGVEPELPHELSRPALAYSYAPLAFTRPFFYGRRRNMVFALMFDQSDNVRFTHSPTGGGGVNPAWDFQWVLRRPVVDREYHLRARALYKPWVSADDVLREYESWDPLLS